MKCGRRGDKKEEGMIHNLTKFFFMSSLATPRNRKKNYDLMLKT